MNNFHTWVGRVVMAIGLFYLFNPSISKYGGQDVANFHRMLVGIGLTLAGGFWQVVGALVPLIDHFANSKKVATPLTQELDEQYKSIPDQFRETSAK